MLGQSPVSPRPEVGDAADQGVPPGGDLRSRGPLISGRSEGRVLALAWRLAGLRPTARIGPKQDKEGGKLGYGAGLWLRERNRPQEGFGPNSREREEEKI